MTIGMHREWKEEREDKQDILVSSSASIICSRHRRNPSAQVRPGTLPATLSHLNTRTQKYMHISEVYAKLLVSWLSIQGFLIRRVCCFFLWWKISFTTLA